MEGQSIEKTTRSKFLNYYEKYMIAAGVLGQMLFYIQGIKIFLTRSANDISIFGFSIGIISYVSWVVYGVLIKNRAILITNSIGLIGIIFASIGTIIHSNW